MLATPASPGEDNLTVSLRKIASLLKYKKIVYFQEFFLTRFLYFSNSVFMVVGAQVCLLPETTIYSTGFLNNALSKVSLCATDLLRQVGPINETVVEGNALSDIVQFGRHLLFYFI